MRKIVGAQEHVTEQIYQYINDIGIAGKAAGGNVHVVCPFHDENTPSCSVSLDNSSNIPIGTFYCFGCGESGSWNKFAKKTGLELLKNYQRNVKDVKGVAERHRSRKREVVGTDNLTLDRLFKEVGNQVIPWPKKVQWRGYEGELLNKIGAYCFNERHKDELMLVFPVYTNGRFRGGVRAFTKKRKGGASYLTTKGDWVKDYGLLGYDMMRNTNLFGTKRLVLVEGPRDWLRMIENDIPCCAILGALMMSEKKMALISGLGVRHLYIIGDNDSAGARMARFVKSFADKALIKCTVLNLPRKKGEDGKVIPLDPDNAPQAIVDEIKHLTYRKTGL